jgi:hypothetical protein
MGITFSASLDINNNIIIKQTRGNNTSSTDNNSLSTDNNTSSTDNQVFIEQLQNLINTYGYTKLTIDSSLLQSYLETKMNNNINLLKSINPKIINSIKTQITPNQSENLILTNTIEFTPTILNSIIPSILFFITPFSLKNGTLN